MRFFITNSAIKRFCDRFIRLDDSSERIALGVALGLVIGMTPFWGTHIILSLGLSSLLGWNKIAAIAGVNITNIFTAPLIYPVNYWVGLRLAGFSRGARLPATLEWQTMVGLVKESPLILADLTIGGMVLGLPLALCGYYAVFRVVRRYRKRNPSPMAIGHDRSKGYCSSK